MMISKAEVMRLLDEEMEHWTNLLFDSENKTDADIKRNQFRIGAAYSIGKIKTKLKDKV